jgi:hypothetical protein
VRGEPDDGIQDRENKEQVNCYKRRASKKENDLGKKDEGDRIHELDQSPVLRSAQEADFGLLSWPILELEWMRTRGRRIDHMIPLPRASGI